MGILTKGDNRLFINTPSLYPLLFTKFNAAGTINETSTSALGDELLIGGYGRVKLADITKSVRGVRGRVSTKEKLSIDGAVAAQITLRPGFTVGKKVRFIVYTSLNYGQSVEFHNLKAGLGDQYSKRHFFTVKLRASDTATSILQRLSQSINYNAQVEYGELPYKASFAGSVFTLEAKLADYNILIGVLDAVDTPSTEITTLAPVTVTEGYEGLNQYENLHVDRLQTEARNEPYSLQQYESPLLGKGYTSVEFFTKTFRPDLVFNELADGGELASINGFQLFIADGNEVFLNEVLTFLTRSGAGVVKYYSVRTNAQAISGDLNNATKAEFTAAA